MINQFHKIEKEGRLSFIMNGKKLEYVFYNPNTEEVTIEHILRILIEANMTKVDKVIQETDNCLGDTRGS